MVLLAALKDKKKFSQQYEGKSAFQTIVIQLYYYP